MTFHISDHPRAAVLSCQDDAESFLLPQTLLCKVFVHFHYYFTVYVSIFSKNHCLYDCLSYTATVHTNKTHSCDKQKRFKDCAWMKFKRKYIWYSDSLAAQIGWSTSLVSVIPNGQLMDGPVVLGRFGLDAAPSHLDLHLHRYIGSRSSPGEGGIPPQSTPGERWVEEDRGWGSLRACATGRPTQQG